MPDTSSPCMYALPAKRFADVGLWLRPLGEKAPKQLQKVSSAACHRLPPAVHVPVAACATLHYSHMVAQLQGGKNELKLSKQATDVTSTSLQAITHLLAHGVGHTDMLRADLPALLTKIIRSPACQAVPDMVDHALACMYPFTVVPAGKAVLLQQLTAASVEPFIHVALRWLEDPESAYSRLVAASGWCLPVPLLPHTPLCCPTSLFVVDTSTFPCWLSEIGLPSDFSFCVCDCCNKPSKAVQGSMFMWAAASLAHTLCLDRICL